MSTAGAAAEPKLDPRVERTRQVALDSAKRLLREEGWDALTHVRLAAASGISRMTLYRHWPTRLDLLRDTLFMWAADYRHPNLTGDLRVDLKNNLQLLRRELLAREQVLLATLIERSLSDRKIARLRDESVAQVCSGLVAALKLGVESGNLPPDLDIDMSVTALVGPCIYELLLNGKALTASFVNEVIDSFLLRYERTA
jgi:AcrR family transcriptional regulator